MILEYILTARAFLKRVPWQVYAVLALLAAFPVTYCTGHKNGVSDGRAAVLAALRDRQDKAEEKALVAVSKADKAGAERAEVEAKVIERQIEAIEEAEAAGDNPLDGLFGG